MRNDSSGSALVEIHLRNWFWFCSGFINTTPRFYIEITEKFWPFLSSLQLLLQLFLGRIIMVHILEDKGIKARSEAGEGMAPNQSI